MRVARWWNIAAVIGATAFLACGGVTDNEDARRITTGSLVVNATGLPTTISPDFTLARESDQSTTDIAGNEVKQGLSPGSYVLTAKSYPAGTVTYDPQPATQTITITAGESATAGVAYAIRSGKINVSVTGLPSGVNADVALTRPGSNRITVTQSAQVSAAIGTWRLTALPVMHEGVPLSPTPSLADAVVSTGATAQLSVHYSANAGPLTVTVSGLGAGTDASVQLTGPNGYARAITATTTIPLIPFGTYTVTANDIPAGNLTYKPTARAQQVSVTSADQVTSANVTYHATDDLSVEFAYITQTVQHQNGGVPLLASRDALLRVFVINNRLNSLTPVVRARIYNGQALISTLMLDAPEPSTRPAVAEGILSSTWNALLPANIVQPGMRVLIDVDPGDTVDEANETNNVWPRDGAPRPVSVVTVPPFAVRFVPVTTGALTGNVTDANKEQYLQTLRRLFPLSEISADVRLPFTSSITSPLPSVQAQWSQVLSELNVLKQTDGAPVETHYYGVVKVTYGGGIAGLGYVGFPGAMGWDHLPSGDGVAAHEWGHNFNRRHAPCGNPGGPEPEYPHAGGLIGVYGWNRETNALVPPNASDIMGYCSNAWISDWTWTKVIDFRQSRSQQFAARQIAATRGEGLMVWGRIQNGTIVLEPAFRVSNAPTVQIGAASHMVEALDANGALLLSIPVVAQAVDHVTATDERHFAVVVPWSDALERSLATIRVRDARSYLGGTLRTSRAARSSIASQGAAPVFADPAASVERAGVNRVRVQWNREEYPLAVVRDVATGQIIAFVREPGSAIAARDGRDLELIVSDGVRSISKRQQR